MILSSLRARSLSSAGLDWYVRLTTAAEVGDLDTFSTFLNEDCEYQVNTFLPFHGRNTVAMALQRYRDTFEHLEHELLNVHGSDLHFAVESLNHYVRKDGSPVTISAAAFFDRDEAGLLLSGRLYVDLTPLVQTGSLA